MVDICAGLANRLDLLTQGPGQLTVGGGAAELLRQAAPARGSS